MIIRRNPDGSIIEEQATQQSHPALTTRRGMAALSESGRAVPPLFSEIATKINNAKDKPKKLKVLKENDSVPLRQVLKGAFDPNIEWLLPDGDVPYTANDAPVGTEHTLLQQEAKRLYLFTKGGDNTLTNNKRELLTNVLLHLIKLVGINSTCLRNSRLFDQQYMFQEIMKI